MARARKGFTLIEILMAIAVVSILLVTAYGIYDRFNENAIRVTAMERFSSVFAKMRKSVTKDGNRLKYVLMLRDYVASPEEIEANGASLRYSNRSEYILKTYDSIVPAEGIDAYRLIPSDPTARERCENFWGVGKDEAYYRGSFYLALMNEAYETSPEGVRYPYKNVTLVDFGPFYKNFKKLAEETTGNDRFVIDELFEKTKTGFHLKKTIDESDQDEMRAVKLLTGFADESKALAEWREKRDSVLARTISFAEPTADFLHESVETLKKAAKNVEDWATTTAKINAYNAVIGGSGLDKDYFVTCSKQNSGTNGCEVEYGDPSNQTSGEMDSARTLYPELDPGFTMEEAVKSSKYGFFLCESDGNGGCDTSRTVLYAMDYTRCADEIYADEQEQNSLAGVFGAVRTGGVNAGDPAFVLNPGMRPFLATARENPFGLPYYFSSAKSIYFETRVADSGGAFTDKYVLFENNAPLVGIESRPPYTASLYAVFPWFVGGYETVSGTSSSYSALDPAGNPFGIYEIKIFAHM